VRDIHRRAALLSRPVAIPFPRGSSKDEPARAGVGRLLNVIMEQRGDESVIYKRAPGVAAFATSSGGAVHCRGFVRASANTVIAVFNGYVEAVSRPGGGVVVTPLGPLDGARIVSLAVNNKAPTPDIVAVTEVGAFIINLSGPPTPYPDADVGSPNGVCFGDGYFFFTYGDGRCIATALNGTAINLLDSALINSASDGCVRGVWFSQTLFLFTPSRCEAWVNTANPTGFPFSRAAVIPRGLASATAIAGFEDNFTSSLIWVGSDSMVYIMRGYEPYRISTNDMERRIQDVADKTTLRANVYMCDGHAFWQLSSADFTFVYDLTNSVWAERASYGQAFSRIEQSIYAFGEWIVGDYATGKLGTMQSDVFSEYDQRLVFDIASLPVSKFPADQVVGRADFDFVAGVGIQTGASQIETDPVVDVSWSDDGGGTFKMPVQRALGKGGETGAVVSVLRTGQAGPYGRVWRLRVSDPVFIGLLGGAMEASV